MKKALKRLIIFFVCIVVIFAASFPTLISQTFLKPYVLSFASAFIEGDVSAKKIQASWFDGFTLEDVILQDQKKIPVAVVSKIASNTPLYAYLFAHPPVKNVRLQAQTLLVTDSTGVPTIDKLLGKKQEATPFKNLTIKNLSLSLQITEKKEADLLLSFSVTDDSNNESGALDVTAKTSNLPDFQANISQALSQNFQKLDLPEKTEVSVQVTKLPTSLIDTVVQTFHPKAKNLVVSSLGSHLSCDFQQKMAENAPSFSLNIQSDSLEAKLGLTYEQEGITLSEPAFLSYTIQPSFVEKLQKLRADAFDDVQLKDPVTFYAKVVPEKSDRAFRFSLHQNTPVVLESTQFPSSLTATLGIEGETPSLKKELSAKLLFNASINEESVKVKSDLLCKSPLEHPHITVDTEVHAAAKFFGKFYTKLQKSLDDLIGENLHLNIKIESTEGKSEGSWNVESETLQGKGAFAVSDGIVSAPTEISYKVDQKTAQKFMPQGYALLTDIAASCNCDAKIDLNSFDKSSVECTVAANDCAVQYQDQKLELNKTKIILSKKPYESTFLDVSAQTALSGETTIQTDVTLNAEAKELFTKKILAKLQAPNLDLYYKNDHLGSYSLEIPFEVDREHASITSKILLQSNKDELLSCTLAIKKEKDAHFEQFGLYSVVSDALIEKFPVPILEKISGQKELVTFFGEYLTGNWRIHYDPLMKKSTPWALRLNGQDFSLETNLKFGPKVTGKNALAMSYKMTPERFSLAQKLLKKAGSEKKEVVLERPIDISFVCKNIELDLDTILSHTSPFTTVSLLTATSLDCTLSKTDMALRLIEKASDETYPLVLAGSTAHIKLLGKNSSIDFEVVSDKKELARIDVRGTAKNVWDQKDITLDNATLSLDLQVDNFPLDILHVFTESDEIADQIVDVFGKRVNADVTGKLTKLNQGTLQGELTTEKLSSKVDCFVKDGGLYLNEAITASYELSEQAGQVLLKDVNPLLVTALHTKNPISLRIDSDKFYVPLAPFSLKEMRIKNITIDPGVITAKNRGMLALLSALLKVKADDEITLWFTPLYLDVKKGVVQCMRSDILFAESYPIATWGSIDLVKDKVDMTLGLSGEAVSKAFNVSGLTPETMIQIPIKGSTKSPKFDTKWATAKITGLKLQERKLNTTSIIGGLLEIAASTQEKEPPKPTTYPFPWQKQTGS